MGVQTNEMVAQRARLPDKSYNSYHAGVYQEILAENVISWSVLENGLLHSINDEPAVIFKDEFRVWCLNGQISRLDDKPAMMHEDGTVEWYLDGKLYRKDGLHTQESSDGTKAWGKSVALFTNKNGVARVKKLHRDNDLPAIEWANGTKEWFQDDLKHRDNGLPAIEWANGAKEYWEHGVKIGKAGFRKNKSKSSDSNKDESCTIL